MNQWERAGRIARFELLRIREWSKGSTVHYVRRLELEPQELRRMIERLRNHLRKDEP